MQAKANKVQGLAVGDTGPEFVFGPVTRTDMVRFAGAVYDFIPSHHDLEHAREIGYKDVFSPGLFQVALGGSFLTRWFGPDSVRRYKTRLREQVWPGDILTARGRVVAVTGDRAEIELEMTRQDGAPVLTGTASVDIAAL